jgi:ABC-2 type transport system ATP-binding protein
MLAVETKGLTRVYSGHAGKPDIVALEALNLQIEAGEVRGLLGPNGAGKTTLVKLLCTILLPTQGTATVLGHDVVLDPYSVRKRVGIVIGGERGLYWNLTARQNLEYWAALYAVPVAATPARVSALLERVGLSDRAEDPVESYSRGMKQRLHLARALIGDPRVLFLDEPTSGMDPVAQHDFRRLLRELRSDGRTILLTTHDMAEAEAVCDRVVLIDRGRVLTEETPQTLARLVSQHDRIDFECGDLIHIAALRNLPGVAGLTAIDEGRSYRIEVSESSAIGDVLAYLVRNGVTSIRTSRPTLEEVYLHLISGSAARV